MGAQACPLAPRGWAPGAGISASLRGCSPLADSGYAAAHMDADRPHRLWPYWLVPALLGCGTDGQEVEHLQHVAEAPKRKDAGRDAGLEMPAAPKPLSDAGQLTPEGPSFLFVGRKLTDQPSQAKQCLFRFHFDGLPEDAGFPEGADPLEELFCAPATIGITEATPMQASSTAFSIGLLVPDYYPELLVRYDFLKAQAKAGAELGNSPLSGSWKAPLSLASLGPDKTVIAGISSGPELSYHLEWVEQEEVRSLLSGGSEPIHVLGKTADGRAMIRTGQGDFELAEDAELSAVDPWPAPSQELKCETTVALQTLEVLSDGRQVFDVADRSTPMFGFGEIYLCEAGEPARQLLEPLGFEGRLLGQPWPAD